MLPSPNSQYSYNEQSNWSFSPSNGTTSHSGGSLSSLLNPSNGYSATRPHTTGINTYPTTAYQSVSMRSAPHNGSTTSLSPDSRPATGYSVSSMSSLSTPYEDTAGHFGHHDYSRPNSSHHPSSARPITPSSRPPSSKSAYPGSANSLSIRRDRRHSHAMSPYPSPYGDHPPPSAGSERPSTSPQPSDDQTAGAGSIPRVRSMIQLPSVGASVGTYGFDPSQADFAYHPVDDVRQSQGHTTQAIYGSMSGSGRSVRPSTSASSLSTSSSAANTPGGDGFGAAGHEGADISRCE